MSTIKLEVTAIDPEVVDAIARKVIELTGNIPKKESFEKSYDVNEVADIVGKTGQTIRKHIKDGLLEANKTGKSWTITKSNLKNYVNGK